jgi:CRP-like cAMP-binding protein
MERRGNRYNAKDYQDHLDDSFYNPDNDMEKIIEMNINESDPDMMGGGSNFNLDSPVLKNRKSVRKTPIMRNLKTDRNISNQNSNNKMGSQRDLQSIKTGSEYRVMGNPYTKNLVRQPIIELEDLGVKSPDQVSMAISKNSLTPSGKKLIEEGNMSKIDKRSTLASGLKLKRDFTRGNKSKISFKNPDNQEELKQSPPKKDNNIDNNQNINLRPKKNSELILKKHKKEEEEKLQKLMENNRSKIEIVRSIFYYSVKAKNEVTNYIISSGNYDSRNREVPWYIILPNGKGKRTWDVLMTFFLIFSLVIIPIDVGWNLECFTENEGQAYRNFYTICSILFMLDIFLNFFTAVLNEKNQYIYNPAYITNHYMTNNFIFDAMAATPFDKFKSFDISDCFKDYIPPSKVFLLFNLVRFLKLGKYIAIIEDLLNKYITYVRLVKICLTLLYLAHFFGNFFCGTSTYASEVIFSSCSWTTTLEERNSCLTQFMQDRFLSIYFYSVYIGMYFLTGNELSVSAYWERLYSVLVVVFGLGLNASVFGNVAVLLGKMSVGLDPFVQEKIDIMKEYMNFMKFETETIDTIQEYHKNIWMKQRNMMYPEDFFDNLSSALHKLILLDQWKNHFFEISIFLPEISESFFGDMLPLLRPKIFMKDDIIISEGEITTGTIFFIPRNCSCSVKIGGEWVRNMTSGEFFGEIAIFLRSRRRTATITCLKNSDFLSIEGEDMEKLLQDYPEDFESIKVIAKDRILSHIKLYPSKLFAKLVPKNDLKDYLIRKCIYLNDEEEDAIFEEKKTENATINLDKIMPKLEQCNNILNITKNRLTSLNKKLKPDNEENIINID